jgi:hypothetical protein
VLEAGAEDVALVVAGGVVRVADPVACEGISALEDAAGCWREDGFGGERLCWGEAPQPRVHTPA